MKSLSWKRGEICSLLQAAEIQNLHILLSYPRPTLNCMFEDTCEEDFLLQYKDVLLWLECKRIIPLILWLAHGKSVTPNRWDIVKIFRAHTQNPPILVGSIGRAVDRSPQGASSSLARVNFYTWLWRCKKSCWKSRFLFLWGWFCTRSCDNVLTPPRTVSIHNGLRLLPVPTPTASRPHHWTVCSSHLNNSIQTITL